MSEDYWDGAIWVYHSIVANEAAAGASTISWTVVPGTGNEMEVLYGRISNLDTAGRAVTVDIETDTAGELLSNLVQVTMNAGAGNGFPQAITAGAGGAAAASGTRYIVAGTMRLVGSVLSVADGEDAEFGLVCRVRGGVPTVTEAGAGTIVITELDEREY